MRSQVETPAGAFTPPPARPTPHRSDGLIPIVVGVTGHRDLCADDRVPLERAVRELLARVRARFPTSPLVLITPLAEGADRLAARVAIEAGAELVVPLPMPQAEYETDFPASVGEFRELLAHRQTVRVAEAPLLRTGAGTRDASPDESRALQYALVGAYVARHSHILLALWDGRETGDVGGTGHIVRFRRTGQLELAHGFAELLESAPSPFGLSATPLDPHDGGPVYQVVTPRAGEVSPDDPFSARWLLPERSTSSAIGRDGWPTALAASLTRIESFNADATRLAERDGAAVERSEGQLYDARRQALPTPLGGLRRAFGLADALALRYQRETYGVLLLLHVLAFVAVLCFEAYAHLLPPDDSRVTVLLAAYLGILGIADLAFLYTRHRQSQNKFQDYRAVAEGLRVQFYWRLAGLAPSVADYYLRKQKDELVWIREAIRSWSVRAAPASDGDVDALAHRWIEDQRAYFQRAVRRESERQRRQRSIAAGVIFASLLWAVPTVAVDLSHLPPGRLNWSKVSQVPLLVVSLVLAWHIAFKGVSLFRQARGREGGTRSLVIEVRTFLASTALGLAFMLLMQHVATWVHARWPRLPGDEHGWTVAALGIITALGALVHSYTVTRAFGEHARQYARMGEMFTSAGERMAALLHDGRQERARALAVELGREALAEHGDWVMLHRERAIELPRVEV